MGVLATVQCNSCREQLEVNGTQKGYKDKVRKFYAAHQHAHLLRWFAPSEIVAGLWVWLPDVKSWHMVGTIENHGKNGYYAWFGMSSHATILRDSEYMVKP